MGVRAVTAACERVGCMRAGRAVLARGRAMSARVSERYLDIIVN